MESISFILNCNGKPVGPPETMYIDPISLTDTLKYCNIADQKKGELLISTEPLNTIRSSLGNSFVGAIFDAYSHHYKLVLRPDDLWLTIVIAFANYVNYHAEEMRDCFVTHDGKK